VASQVQIANLALNIIGADPILAFTDDNERARAINLIYTDTRDAELRAHPWNFAIKRQALTKSTETPAFEFDNKYKLPSDHLRTLEFNYREDDYQQEGEYILTDADSAKLRYVARITNPVLFDPLFVQAFAARLAINLAEPVAADTEKVNNAFARYDRAIADARAVDAMENPVPAWEVDTYLEARWGFQDRFRNIEDPD